MAKKLRVAVNGFGRIGRIFTRVAWNNPNLEIVAINSRSGAGMYAHLLKYDSVYGVWDKKVSSDGEDTLVIGGKRVPLTHEDKIENIPWKKYKVDLVVEATGAFRKREDAEKHLTAGAKYVVVSAPAKGEDKTLINKINTAEFDPKKHKILSAASCTTTCLAPVVKTLHEAFGIKHGNVVTAHAYTNDQNLVDQPHRKDDLRRSRAAAVSIIPTETGAAKTIVKFVPDLEGKLDGMALRVPEPTVSVIYFVAELAKATTAEEVNKKLKDAAKGKLKGLMDVSDLPLVSVDYRGSDFGSVVDAPYTKVLGGTQVSILAWYDNEWGYVRQLTNLLEYIGSKI